MMTYKKQRNRKIVLTFDDSVAVQDLVLSECNTDIISYSHSSNVIGVATTRNDEGGMEYHAYQTNECGYLKWDKWFPSLDEAKQYAEEMHEGFIAYSKSLQSSYEEFQNELNNEDVAAAPVARPASSSRSAVITPINYKYILIVRDSMERNAILQLLPKYSEYFTLALLQELIGILPLDQKDIVNSAISSIKTMSHGVVLLPMFNVYSSRRGKDFFKFKRELDSDELSTIKWSDCEPLHHIEYESLFPSKLYADAIKTVFNVSIPNRNYEDKYFWNLKMALRFSLHGVLWTSVQNQVKQYVVDNIPKTRRDIQSMVCGNKEMRLSEAGSAIDKLLRQTM